ncbi:uncharacterized protein LOC141607667 [Silene latifolia]|uniref:uncharacterized protein LOC141607667 n=1 Tax=Silene latifolia TaxID=37657 RepID=UPI003D76DEAA
MHWSHYLKPKPFVLHSDHEALRFTNSQNKLSHSKYKEGRLNVVADVLSREHSLLTVIEQRVLGFEFMKELYREDPYFFEEWINLSKGGPTQGSKYLMHEGFLFHGKKLCVPRGSCRELLIKEIHVGGSGGHFGVQKTLDIMQD